MKLSLRSIFVALFATSPAFAQTGVASAPVASGTQPWLADRAVGEGAGIRLGSFELHPGVSGEIGYDSNWYQRGSSAAELANIGPVIDAFRLRVTPSLNLRTLDRRADLGPEGGPSEPRPVEFSLNSSLTYNELIATQGQFQGQLSDERNLQGNLGAEVGFFRGRKWSGHLGAGYAYLYEPANIAGYLGAFNRHVINAGAGVRWAPGGGSFEWNLVDYRTSVTLFDSDQFGVYDNGDHTFTTSGRWRFLPKTALLYDGAVGLIRYANPALNSGVDTTTRIGINGLLLTRLGVLVMGGWAVSFRENTNGMPRSYDDFVARAELKYYLTSNSRLQPGSANVGVSSLAAGYDRSFDNSYLGDFLQRDRGYGQMTWAFGGRWVTVVDGGVSAIHYPDLLFDSELIPSFGEVRVDVQGFLEYRPLDTLGVNLTLRYDQNISRVLDGATYSDDLSFARFRGFVGVRWFL